MFLYVHLSVSRLWVRSQLKSLLKGRKRYKEIAELDEDAKKHSPLSFDDDEI